MKPPRHVWNRKPRPKGWKNVVRAVTPRKLRDKDETPAPIPSGEGYLLAPCVVLIAAIVGTRAAYEWAMDNLEGARMADARRFW